MTGPKSTPCTIRKLRPQRYSYPRAAPRSIGYARLLFKYILFAAVFAAGAYATPNPTACNADNCLRALRGLASKSYSRVSSDCANYVYTTAAPSAVIVFETITESFSITLPTDVSYTVTETVTQGVDAETVYSLITETGPSRTIIVTQTDPIPPPITLKKRGSNNKRCTSSTTDAAPTGGSTSPVPTYASACTSGARYASACSCFGVPASIATTGGSTITSTITTSVTETFYSTNSVVAGTEHITITAAAEAVTLESTTTIASTVTNTAFALLHVDGPKQDGRVWMAQRHTAELQFYYPDVGTTFIRDHDGRVYFPETEIFGAMRNQRHYGYCYQYPQPDSDDIGPMPVIQFLSRGRQSTDGIVLEGTEVYCDIDAENIINCHCTTSEGYFSTLMFGPYGLVQLASEGYEYREGWGEGPIKLKAVTSFNCGAGTQASPECSGNWDAERDYTYKRGERNSKVRKGLSLRD
ncbi:hypothetical protein TWF281_004124 [Arthrobotrys megalospora]